MMTKHLPHWCAYGIDREYRTAKAVQWHIGKKHSGWVLHIAPGREFESSVPWVLRWLIDPRDPRLLLAALIHDDLLESGHRRFFAAGEWYDAALKGGVSKWLALPAAVVLAILVDKRVD